MSRAKSPMPFRKWPDLTDHNNPFTPDPKKEYATPIGDRVLVKVKQKEIKTPSGLLVAQTNPVLPIEGVVVAVGDDRKIECRVGDRVCFGKFAGVEVRLNGEDHIVLAADEVLGILE